VRKTVDGCKKGELTGTWRKLHEELENKKWATNQQVRFITMII
jgi:hypothetical protein